MVEGRNAQVKKCYKVAKDIIQAAEPACFGSLRLIHTPCATRPPDKIPVLLLTMIIVLLHWKSLITKKSSHSYQLCKAMAICIDDVINAYVPPVPVIPETRQQYSLRFLGLPEDNFNIVTVVMILMLITIHYPSLG